MSRRFVRLLSLALVLACATACQRKEAENPYFPLDAGRTWTYRMTGTTNYRDLEPRTLSVASIGEEEVQGVKVAREKITLDGDEHFLFVGVDDKGVFRHATQSPGEPAPSVDEVRDYFLSYPVAVGKKWKGKGAPSFIDAVDEPIAIESTIESVTDTVEVPAGRFTDCVKVRVTGTAQVEPEDDLVDPDDPEEEPGQPGTFTLVEQTWYAKDVGIVKSVVQEVYEGEFDEDHAEITTELQSFTR